MSEKVARALLSQQGRVGLVFDEQAGPVAGRASGPFATADDLFKHLDRSPKAPTARKRTSRR